MTIYSQKAYPIGIWRYCVLSYLSFRFGGRLRDHARDTVNTRGSYMSCIITITGMAFNPCRHYAPIDGITLSHGQMIDSGSS